MMSSKVSHINLRFTYVLLSGLLLGWVFLAVAWTPFLQAAETASPPPLTLQSLNIVGTETIKPATVRKQMTMTLPSRWPWRKKPPFREDHLKADIEQLKTFYRSQGFYHTRITPEIQKKNGQVEVVLRIQEGPSIRVTRVEVNGAEVIDRKNHAEIRAQSPLKPGARFTDERYEDLKRAYFNFLQNHGYFRGRVAGKVYLDDQANTARIVFTLTPGPLCYFGEATVKGEGRTPQYLILRKLAFKKGELFSLNKIFDSQKNLYDTDLFRSAAVTPEDKPGELTTIPITVAVQEKKSRSIRVGLGYGDEELFRARLGLRVRNVAGGGRMLDIEGKYSSIETRGTGTFTSPQIFTSHLDFVASTGWIRRELPSFTDQSYYTQARLERALPWRFRAYAGHGFEYARPFNIPLSTLIQLQETEPNRIYKSSMFIFGLSQDTTVNPSDPTGGGKLSLSGEGALDFLGSNLEFFRTIAEVRRYQTIVRNFVLSGRFKFGIIQPIQSTTQIPIQRRFFSGGYNSVRGYRLDYLGPRTASGDPLGGDAVVEGNVEARMPLYKKLRAIGFLDFGNVYFKASDIDLGKLKYAGGFGVSYLTPIGPVGLYFAWPLNPINPSEDTFRVHFTIGPSF